MAEAAAALATSTDATGGGEVTSGVAAARNIRAAMHRSLRSGHKQAHMNYGPLTVCLDAIDAALATPTDATDGATGGGEDDEFAGMTAGEAIVSPEDRNG